MHNRVLHETINTILLNRGDILQINEYCLSNFKLYSPFHYPSVMNFALSCGCNINIKEQVPSSFGLSHESHRANGNNVLQGVLYIQYKYQLNYA